MTVMASLKNLAKFFYHNDIPIYNHVRITVDRDFSKMVLRQRGKGDGELVYECSRWKWKDRPCEAAYSFCCEDLRREFNAYSETKRREKEMSRASEMDPMRNEERQRHPKACKIQMFTRREQVWLDAMKAIIGGRTGPIEVNHAVEAADDVLNAFDKRFK